MKLKTKIIGLSLLAVVAATSFSYVRYSGGPYWRHGSGGYHYVVSLRPVSFPTGSQWDRYAQYAMSDLRDLGDTDYNPAFNRASTSYTNHGDGKNAWVWLNRSSDSYLGVTFVRWSGSTMKDCDIWYNSRYSWTTGVYGPDREPARAVPPYAFRNTARHENIHAIGFTHENGTLSNVNSCYTDGRGVPHHDAYSGLMPQATDKHGMRVVYPAATTERNVYAGRWREPSSTCARRLSITGTWAAGSTRSVPCWLSNQSNVTILGGSGSSGIRVGVYLSTNSTISTSDALISQRYFTGNWPAHAAGYYELGATVPSTFTPGTYYVGVIFDNTNVVSERFETSVDNDAIVGRVTVTNVTRALTVRSTNPSSAVPITVSLTDRNGNKNGNTTFYRYYWGNRTVSLTAPSSTAVGPFKRWYVTGVGYNSSRVVSVNLNTNRTATAEYYQYTKGTMTRFGKGCPGTGGKIPFLTGSGTPEIAHSIAISVTSARPRALGRLLLGISNRTWMGVRLPWDLAPIGAKGCYLNVSLDLEVPIAYSSTGAFLLKTTIPNNVSDIGRHYYLQAMVIDPGTKTPLKVVTSNGLDIYVGGNK